MIKFNRVMLDKPWVNEARHTVLYVHLGKAGTCRSFLVGKASEV